MRSGKLRHVITIEQPTDGHGATYNEGTLTFADLYANIRAAVIPLTGKELFGQSKVEAGVSHRVEMRYRPDITPKCRVQFKGRTLEIVSIINLEERNKELHLMCWEQV